MNSVSSINPLAVTDRRTFVQDGLKALFGFGLLTEGLGRPTAVKAAAPLSDNRFVMVKAGPGYGFVRIPETGEIKKIRIPHTLPANFSKEQLDHFLAQASLVIGKGSTEKGRFFNRQALTPVVLEILATNSDDGNNAYLDGNGGIRFSGPRPAEINENDFKEIGMSFAVNDGEVAAYPYSTTATAITPASTSNKAERYKAICEQGFKAKAQGLFSSTKTETTPIATK